MIPFILLCMEWFFSLKRAFIQKYNQFCFIYLQTHLTASSWILTWNPLTRNHQVGYYIKYTELINPEAYLPHKDIIFTANCLLTGLPRSDDHSRSLALGHEYSSPYYSYQGCLRISCTNFQVNIALQHVQFGANFVNKFLRFKFVRF